VLSIVSLEHSNARPVDAPPMSFFVNAPPGRASNRCAPEKVRAKSTGAVQRGPITRRQHSLAKKRDENETRSLLLQLNDDLLEKVLSFLPGRELAAMETVCTHFRYGSWLAANKTPLPETSAKRKLDALELGDMPPGFKCVSSFSLSSSKKVEGKPSPRETAPSRLLFTNDAGFG